MSFNRWRSLVDGEVIVRIPESEADQKLLHRWVLDDVNGTVEDSAGDVDGTNNGVTPVSGDWAGGSAGDGDGISDHINLGRMGDFGSSVLPNDFAVAFSIQTTVGAEDGHFCFGMIDSDGDQRFRTRISDENDGDVSLDLRSDTQDNMQARTGGGQVDDGNPHRVVWNKTGSGASDQEVWVDQNELSLTTDNDDNPTSFSDFDTDMILFASGTEDDTDDFHIDAIIDDFCFFDDSLTQSEIESYQNPW